MHPKRFGRPRKSALATRSGPDWQGPERGICPIRCWRWSESAGNGRKTPRYLRRLRPRPLVADALQFHRAVGDRDPEGGADGAFDQMDVAAMGADQFGGDRKPSPLPPGRPEVWNASNRCSRAFAGTPGPVSETSMIATEPSRRPVMRICKAAASPLGRLSSACAALRTRLSSTRNSWSGSASIESPRSIALIQAIEASAARPADSRTSDTTGSTRIMRRSGAASCARP